MYRASQIITAPMAFWLVHTLGFGQQFSPVLPVDSMVVGLPNCVGRLERHIINSFGPQLELYSLSTEFSMGIQEFEKLFSLFQGEAPDGWYPLDSMVMCLPYVSDAEIARLHDDIADALLEHLLYYVHQGDDTTDGVFEQFIAYAHKGHWHTVKEMMCELYARAHTLLRQMPRDGGDDVAREELADHIASINTYDDVPWQTANEMEHGPDYYRDSASLIQH